jgi:quercetin dioxygenase-like cupin family protein
MDSCFHNLGQGGIERELAPGVRARVFPGVHAMLSVVTLEPHAVSPLHSPPQEQ